MQSLPIDSVLPEIIDALRRESNVVVEAPPGAGKTTRVPAALLDAGVAGDGEVWVLEPRRLAARLSARRVAEERGERAGESVGYQVRFEEVSGPHTRLRFLTEGVLTRRLLSDPRLARVRIVVLDEFHERHLQADLALALLRRLQLTSRPDLRLVAMSATLDAAPVAAYLGGCRAVRSEGRRFPVSVEHLPRPDERPLAAQVGSAVRRLLSEGLDGDVLVFLPGAAEIGRAQSECERAAAEHDLLVVPLHGELSAAQQDAAVRPADRRKIILSTNVAETSVTIEGVVAVVDSGLARVASHSPWSGLPQLSLARVSRASATQRAGRAGRTRAGRALRLYTAQDFAARPAHESPEVQRLDLAEPALELHAAGVRDLRAFDWFEPPAEAAIDAAEALLARLGALDAAGGVTETGRRMLRLPLHPRLARLVAEADARGVGLEACVVAALVGERDIRARELFASGEGARPREKAARRHGSSDLLELYDLYAEAARAGFAPERLRRMGLEAGAVRSVERASRQLRRALGTRETGDAGGGLSDEQETQLLVSILAGYPDRVARRRATPKEAGAEEVELLLAGGGAAELAPESVVRRAEFVVAVEAEQRQQQQRPGGPQTRAGRARAGSVVRAASAVEPEWLLELFPERVAETTEARWNPQQERAEAVSRLLYDQIVLTEGRAPDARGAEVSRVLAAAAADAGVEAFAERGALDRFFARVEFLARTFPEADFPALSDADASSALAEMCGGRRSFAELREAARAGELFERLRARLTAEQSRLLARMAPERVALSSGRQARVSYERGRQPSVASRLQDFFGMTDSPRVAGGRVALVVELLAPSNRPVQVTSDLAGFWERHYPQVRRELARRYPRHAWPEDPRAPQPPQQRAGKKSQ